jgi:SAM-dependent methyltransferase
MSIDLYNIDKAITFYDDRYEEGYLEEWDQLKKRKVEEILRSLNLPQKGKALDFGCGNGVFTNIIKNCFPNWNVFGVDISQIAIRNASKKYKQCTFFTYEDANRYQNYFDFVFSHHVLEHVQNIMDTVKEINNYLKPNSSQLHILPCGNEGSFEYNICTLHNNGIEKGKENRFFFEEPGHLRRLTSFELTELMKVIGFSVNRQFFANQYYGAINWITKSSPRFVNRLTNNATAVDEIAKESLIELRKKLLKITYFQFPYSKYWLIKSKWSKKTFDYLKLSFLFLPALLSKPLYKKYDRLAEEEWIQRKTQPNGSEMFLSFERVK